MSNIWRNLATKLELLYDYMIRTLYDASIHNDPEKLDEVSALLREIKAGWDGIADQVES